MKYQSTRAEVKDKGISISEAMLIGLARDGGLFIPKFLPAFCANDFGENLNETAYRFLEIFFMNDQLENNLREICDNTFNFSIPMVHLEKRIEILELYHGPTGAFKDVGARFLAYSLNKLDKHLTVMVATSGDTGSAVASAFHNMENIDVAVLYPKDRISEFQEKQLTCWDNNIKSFRVDGDFDYCQNMVKEIFNSTNRSESLKITSANSINIGRLLPQCVYYVSSSLEYYKKYDIYANYIIPTGNMGNALAAIWTKLMGLPIGKIILASNINDTIPIYFDSGIFKSKPTIRTIASAMDVGRPSNMERYLNLKAFYNFDLSEISAYSVSDEEIKSAIKDVYNRFDRIICPHTATAFVVMKKIDLDSCIIVSTAHPSKFIDTVKPIVNCEIPIPKNMENHINNPANIIDIQTIDDLMDKITQ